MFSPAFKADNSEEHIAEHILRKLSTRVASALRLIATDEIKGVQVYV